MCVLRGRCVWRGLCTSLETMVVACVGVLKDKNGSNQKKMLQWLVQKLQDQV